MMAIIAMTFLTFSCQDKDLTGQNEIIAKDVLDSSEDIATAKALLDYGIYKSDDENVIATADYENDGFKLKLPKTVSDQYLYEVGDEFDGENWITVSDPKAKMNAIWLSAYNNKDKYIGDFYHMGWNTRYYVDAAYIYSDRKFTITGKFEYDDEHYKYTEEFDCNLKKGWNVLYFVDEEFNAKSIITTQKPSEVKMEWIFDESYYWERAYVNFVKEINSEDCVWMGLANDYGTQVAGTYFGEESGGPYGPYWISPGKYNVVHGDSEWNEFVDITNYNFEDEYYYTVVCTDKDGELYFYINKDYGISDAKKSYKFKNVINKLRLSIQKEKTKNSKK
jgi:hypothetical protein